MGTEVFADVGAALESEDVRQLAPFFDGFTSSIRLSMLLLLGRRDAGRGEA